MGPGARLAALELEGSVVLRGIAETSKKFLLQLRFSLCETSLTFLMAKAVTQEAGIFEIYCGSWSHSEVSTASEAASSESAL